MKISKIHFYEKWDDRPPTKISGYDYSYNIFTSYPKAMKLWGCILSSSEILTHVIDKWHCVVIVSFISRKIPWYISTHTKILRTIV